jgi:hypothetical protein
MRSFVLAATLWVAACSSIASPLDVGRVLVGENRDDPGADFAGVAITAGDSAREGTVAGDIGTAMRRMLDGKMEITFVPDKWMKFLKLNPDQLLKILPFSHYLSYIFDYTSKFPVKNGLPSDVNISPFKVHVGNPRSNPNVAALEGQMLVRIQPGANGKGWQLTDPDGHVYADEDFGCAQIVFHNSGAYWGPIIERLKDWYHKHWGTQMAANLDDTRDYMVSVLGEGSKGPEAFIAAFDDEKVLSLYWKIFDRYKSNLKDSQEAFQEVLEILRDISLADTLVMGVGERGLKSVSLLYKIGNAVPFPNLESLLKWIKDIWHHVHGLPQIDMGWPDSDVRMSIITRYHNEQFVEIVKIFVVPRQAADNWHPAFLDQDTYRKVLSVPAQRADAMHDVHADDPRR